MKVKGVSDIKPCCCSLLFARLLYFVVLCIDANFRLKNQLVSNYSADPGLGTGLSYTILRKPYEEYVASRATDLDADVSNIFRYLYIVY